MENMFKRSCQGILNDKVRLDRKKKGFNASINSIIDFQNKDLRKSILDSSSSLYQFIDQEKLKV